MAAPTRLYSRKATPGAVRRTPQGRVYDGLSRLALERQAEVERHAATLAHLAQREADMLARLATLADDAVLTVAPLQLEREWLTVSEAAAVTGYASKTIRRWCDAGAIEASRGDGQWRIRRAALEHYMQTAKGGRSTAALSSERQGTP